MDQRGGGGGGGGGLLNMCKRFMPVQIHGNLVKSVAQRSLLIFVTKIKNGKNIWVTLFARFPWICIGMTVSIFDGFQWHS